MAVEPIAHSSYNSLQTSLTRQFSSGLAGNVAYTWSKCLDDASATPATNRASVPSMIPTTRAWIAVLAALTPTKFSANAIYSLPFHGNRAVNGWQISPIFSRFTGPAHQRRRT